uniref:BTB domain-containing protein n=1 Tax=Labrus bergylta TaxID=56723 RepID=A0A3Q3GX41_9LABR
IVHPQNVLSKLNEQRSQGLFCDVTIVVEDVKFRAHKNILAACSGYFRNALTTPETWNLEPLPPQSERHTMTPMTLTQLICFGVHIILTKPKKRERS